MNPFIPLKTSRNLKIVVRGPAKATRVNSTDVVTDASQLQKLNGAPYDHDQLSNYLDGGPLAEIGIQGGAVRLIFGQNGLQVETEYRSPKRLTPSRATSSGQERVRGSNLDSFANSFHRSSASLLTRFGT